MLIQHRRFEYYKDTTIGEILLDGVHFCYTLEDTVRAEGIKVEHYTAIPAGVMHVGVRYSPSFKRNVLILYTEDDKVTIRLNGVEFKYVYAHGGNDADDTDGCILVAFHRDGNKIYGTAEHALFDLVNKKLEQGEEVIWEIINEPQSK